MKHIYEEVEFDCETNSDHAYYVEYKFIHTCDNASLLRFVKKRKAHEIRFVKNKIEKVSR